MRIKFLHTTPSENPTYPFQAGQVIEVSELSPAMQAALEAQQAVLLPELATVGMPERAVKPRGKGHTR